MRHLTSIALLLTASLCAGGAAAQPAIPPVGASPATAPAPNQLKIGTMVVDLAASTITLQAEVCQSEYGLEFLLCAAGGKEYESVLSTRTRPSQLHAALLALGLPKGKPARWSGVHEGARFLPPQGPQVSIRLRWTDAKGKRREMNAGEWLKIGTQVKQARPPEKWVFVGSQVLPEGTYLADLPGEGGLISVANTASSVIDVPFPSAQDLDARLYQPNAKVMPKSGTPVEVIIRPLAGAPKTPHARVLLEVDRHGSVQIEGEPIAIADIEAWAQKYVARHAQGMVQVRCAPRCRIQTLERVRTELRLGGVDEIDEQRLSLRRELLPRTPTQARRALAKWQHDFRNAKELLENPADVAGEVLEQIEQEQKELDRVKALWEEYGMQLRQLKQGYEASTQPAAGED